MKLDICTYWYLAVDVSLVGLLNHQVDERLHIGLREEGVLELRSVPEHQAVCGHSSRVFPGVFCVFETIKVLGVLGILHKSTCFFLSASIIFIETGLHRNQPLILPISLVLEPEVATSSTTLNGGNPGLLLIIGPEAPRSHWSTEGDRLLLFPPK